MSSYVGVACFYFFLFNRSDKARGTVARSFVGEFILSLNMAENA